jgi:hypothetical protein
MLKTARKPAPEAEITLETDLEWRRAKDRVAELRDALQEKERELADGRALLEQHKQSAEQRSQRVAEGAPLEQGRGAERDLRQHLAGAEEDRKVLARAVEIAEQHFQDETSRASRRLCDAVRPTHQAVTAEIAETLVRLARLAETEGSLRDAVRAAGAVCTLPFCGVPAVGTLKDPNSLAVTYMREAAEYGAVPAGDRTLCTIKALHGWR